MVGGRGLAAALACLGAILAGPAGAEPVTIGGVTFSDELGGFRILSASGSGTTDDPFVVVEEITSPGEAILVIRGAPEPTPRNPRHNRIISGHDIGFALRKVAINRTNLIWTGFDLELQAILGQSSPHDDGLSFGQGSLEQKRTRSDAFESTVLTSEPIDSIVFNYGDVPPGGRVTLDLVVTDLVHRPAIYLLQRQQRALSGKPALDVASRRLR